MTQSDKWKKRPATSKYWEFKDEITKQADLLDFKLPDIYSAVFYLPIPASWSKKKRQAMLLQPHQQKPDKDNLEKALNDALRGDDSGIWLNLIEKRWAEVGAVEIYTGIHMAEHLDACMYLISPETFK